VKRKLVIGGIVVAALLATFFVVTTPTTAGKFPASFSEAERREISSLIRRDAYRQSFKAISRGRLTEGWRWVRNAQRQSVWGVGNQPNGEIWVHVGFEDKSQPDGYVLTARYMMGKEKEQWKIVRMF